MTLIPKTLYMQTNTAYPFTSPTPSPIRGNTLPRPARAGPNSWQWWRDHFRQTSVQCIGRRSFLSEHFQKRLVHSVAAGSASQPNRLENIFPSVKLSEIFPSRYYGATVLDESDSPALLLRLLQGNEAFGTVSHPFPERTTKEPHRRATGQPDLPSVDLFLPCSTCHRVSIHGHSPLQTSHHSGRSCVSFNSRFAYLVHGSAGHAIHAVRLWCSHWGRSRILLVYLRRCFPWPLPKGNELHPSSRVDW